MEELVMLKSKLLIALAQTLVIDSSRQSSFTQHFRSDLHGCRPLPCLQELQVLQTLRQRRWEVRR
jgi:hypothetical protein